MLRLALSALLLMAGIQLFAQDCFDFYKSHCCPSQSSFVYTVNEASVSFAFAPGESKCVIVNLFQGKDYRITICSDSLYSGVVSLVIQNDGGKVLYDNSTDDFSTNIEFSCRRNNETEFIITAPNRLDVVDGTKGCIGILIEDMVTPKIGF